MTEYVLGFFFNERQQSVLVIRQDDDRPNRHAGKFNGIGGHIDAGETPEQAMLREWAEETGLQPPTSIEPYGVVEGAAFRVHLFRGQARFTAGYAHRSEEGHVTATSVSSVPTLRTLCAAGLPALIFAALDTDPSRAWVVFEYE